MDKVLVAEISGKRPGGARNRPTELFEIKYDHVIISNNSDGYETDWEIVNVPPEYMEWYKENYRTSDSAWYAPMNRSYAIKYAKERGYQYLIQLDDNIVYVELAYLVEYGGGISKRFRKQCRNGGMINDFISMLVCILENTNAGMSGCAMAASMPDGALLSERYCYSLFALDLSVCPEVFQGDFEDDIEYRLKLAQMSIPSIQCSPLRYAKTGQVSSKDESGNRAAYTKAGLLRGQTMRRLHGDIYSCGYSQKTYGTNGSSGKFFKHTVKPFKVGVIVKDMSAIEQKFAEICGKYEMQGGEKCIVKKLKRKPSNSVK